MFLKETLHILTDGMKQVFDANYPEEDFRSLNISVEYPDNPQGYPGIWVDFEPTGQLENAGIDLRFYSVDPGDEVARMYRKWRFTGYGTFTLVCLSNLQRARLFDEVVRVIAFGDEAAQTSIFRRFIENNDFIAANADFDQVQVRGFSANPGTPWGTDEVIYEVTLALEVLGEFVSDGLSTTLVPLSKVKVDSFVTGQTDTTIGDGQGAWR